MDHTSHTRVPAVSIRSYVQSDDLSNCTEHGASHSKVLPLEGKPCSGSLSCGSGALMAFCGLPPFLVESQFWDETQMQWSSACASGHARTPTKGLRSMPKLRQVPVECESPSEICDPVAAAKEKVLSEECDSVKESQRAGPRRCASTRPARWQRGDGCESPRSATVSSPRAWDVPCVRTRNKPAAQRGVPTWEDMPKRVLKDTVCLR